MQHKTSTHHSLAKALEILMAFTPHNQDMGTVELSERLGYHKSTVSRLLHVLMDYGFVRQNQESKKFVLGQPVLSRDFPLGRLGYLVSVGGTRGKRVFECVQSFFASV